MSRNLFGLFACVTIALLLVCGSHEANGFQKIVTATQVNGTWQYRGNSFKIWAVGQQKLKVEFAGTYQYKTSGGPMANMGSGSGTARIEGDTAVFRPSEIGKDEECKITMRFTRGKLVVNQEGICGFGLNVNASGTYRRISRTKPKFGDLTTTSHAKTQRRKDKPWKRGSALRLCAFA